MAVSIRRWVAGVAIGCAAFAALLLPFPPTWTPAAPSPLADAIARRMLIAGQAHDAVRSYRAAQAIDRWSAARSGADTTLVRIDRGVPPAVAARARSIALEQWAALATPVSAQHAEVFVYVDSTSIPRADSTAPTRRAIEPKAFVDVAYALPGATGGQCVALVRVRGVSAAHVDALRRQSLIGVCGFYATFGLPGNGIQAWLARSNYKFARRSDWSVARAPVTDASSMYGLSGPAAQCLTGDPRACRTSLRIETTSAAREHPPGDRLPWVLEGMLSPGTSAGASLGPAEDELLADAVRSVGADRFGRFWRSTSAPDRAFFAAAGVKMDAWTQRWLTQVYGAPPPRPRAHVGDIVWLAIAASIALLVATRPRERVLA